MDKLFALNGAARAKENHIQGMFHDLLACLTGGDNPRLPPDHKQKSMKGFCAILDAFNDVIKTQEAGSGVVSEVDSREMMSPNSYETLRSSRSRIRPSTNATSSQSLYPGVISSSESRLSAAVSHLQRSLRPEQIPEEDVEYENAETQHENSDYDEEETKYENAQTQHVSDYDEEEAEEPSEADNFQDAFDYEGENPVLSLLKSRYIEEIGPPLAISPASLAGRSPSPVIDSYADKMKEIELLLKAHSPPESQLFGSQSEFVGAMSAADLMGHGILPSFPESLMSTDKALEKMYHNMESCKPRGKVASLPTFQSCTASIKERHPPPNSPNTASSSASPRSPRSAPRKTLSTYVDCLSLDETISNDDFLRALDTAINRGENDKANRLSEVINRRYKAQRGKEPVRTHVTCSRESDLNNNDISRPYYSINEESDGEFYDASSETIKQRKKKAQPQLHSYGHPTPSEERMWKWTRAIENDR